MTLFVEMSLLNLVGLIHDHDYKRPSIYMHANDVIWLMVWPSFPACMSMQGDNHAAIHNTLQTTRAGRQAHCYVITSCTARIGQTGNIWSCYLPGQPGNR